MGKAPAFQFYPNDWTRDLEEHPLEIEGAWIRICCKLWWSETRGQLSRTLDQWGKILGIDPTEASRILTYIEVWKIGDVQRNSNAEITVTSRRMCRDHKDSEFNRLRQYRWRGKHKSNASVTEMLRKNNDHSSSSSSSSKKKIYVEGSKELRLATSFLAQIRRNKPDFKAPNLQTWSRDFDLLLRRDKRTVDRIEQVVRWTLADSFWRANLLSPSALRRHFDRLEIAMGGGNGSAGKSW